VSTGFATVQAALLAALQGAPALSGVAISANRQRPVSAAQASAMVLRLDQAAGDTAVLGMIDWQTAFALECYARADTGTDPAAAVDSLLSAAWAALAGLDYASAGADITISPTVDWQYDDAATPMVCAIVRITAMHRTTLTNLAPL